MSKVSGISIDEAVARIKAAGLDSIAGAGAEMLPARPRTAIAPLKESGERWLEVMETAHGHGMESTATMMMGTGETNAERIEHLRMIRDVQDRTGGFRSFIPWTYQAENNHLKGRTQATSLEYLRLIAVARLFFDNVNHLQASWLTTGKDIGQIALHMGVDDLGSIMLEENVISERGREAPLQPARADLDDPFGGPHPGPARHALPAHGGALHRGRRPDRRSRGVALLVDRAAGWRCRWSHGTGGRRVVAAFVDRDELWLRWRPRLVTVVGRAAPRAARSVSAGKVFGVSQPTASTPRTRAQLDKQPDEVAAMFDGVAERYDRTNTILSFGRDRAWRQATRDALDLKPGDTVLDLGGGHRRLDRGARPVRRRP